MRGMGLITPISWPEIGLIWDYSVASALVTDLAKVQVYRHLQHRARRHQRFINRVREPLHRFGQAPDGGRRQQAPLENSAGESTSPRTGVGR